MDPLRDFFGQAAGGLFGQLRRKTVKHTETKKSTKGGKRSPKFSGSRGWIAMGTLAAYAVMGGTKSALAYVEKTAGTGGETGSEASLPLKRFNIAAGPLDEAIKQYEQTTG